MDEFYTANLNVYFWLYGAGEGKKKGRAKWGPDLQFPVFSIALYIQIPAQEASTEPDTCA